MHRCTIEANSLEPYYRASIFIPYMDKFIYELEEKFTNYNETLSTFDSLFQGSFRNIF